MLEPAGELGVRLFSEAFRYSTPRCFAPLVHLAVSFALARQFVLGVLLPPVGFVPTPPSIAICLPLSLRVHRCIPQLCLRPPPLQSLSFVPRVVAAGPTSHPRPCPRSAWGDAGRAGDPRSHRFLAVAAEARKTATRFSLELAILGVKGVGRGGSGGIQSPRRNMFERAWQLACEKR